jgi:hypothetical protein
VSDLTAKSRLMPPPVDWGRIDDLRASPPVRRNPAAVFFETRDANVRMLNEAFALLRKRGVAFTAIAVGPADELDPAIPRRAVSELDDEGQARGMLEASIVLSARPEAASDYQVIRALMAGCRPVLPNAGVYPEILPRELHPRCLYDVTPEGLAGWLGTALDEATLPGDPWHYDEFRRAFRPYDAIPVCRQFDQRLEQLAAGENPR